MLIWLCIYILIADQEIAKPGGAEGAAKPGEHGTDQEEKKEAAPSTWLCYSKMMSIYWDDSLP